SRQEQGRQQARRQRCRPAWRTKHAGGADHRAIVRKTRRRAPGECEEPRPANAGGPGVRGKRRGSGTAGVRRSPPLAAVRSAMLAAEAAIEVLHGLAGEEVVHVGHVTVLAMTMLLVTLPLADEM